MNNKFKTLLLDPKISLFYLTILALFTPFLVDVHSYFPFIIAKATVFRLIVEIMLVIWVIGLVKRKIKFILTPLTKAILIFGGVEIISAILGVDPFFSFFSGNERMGGVLGLFHFITFFLIISSSFHWKDIERILKIEIGISLLHIFFALLAYGGIGPITARFTSNRLAGYTGNPSFFAAYLIFNTFLALYFYFQQFTRDKKLFNWWGAIFLFEGVLIFVTGCRGAMMAFLGALFLIALAILFQKGEESYHSLKKIIIYSFIGVAILSGSVFAFRNSSWVQDNIAFKRFSSISLKSPTAIARIMSAGDAWKAFKERPWFGWGPENYEAAYITNFNPQVLKYLPGDFYFDRAHNKIMQILANSGIVGLLSYLAIFGIVLWELAKVNKEKKWFLPSLALGGMFLAYFGENLFLFDFHESYLMFFLGLAFVGAISSRKKVIAFPPPSQKDYSQELGAYFLIISTICLVIFYGGQYVIRPYIVSRHIFQITRDISLGKGQTAYLNLRNTLNNPSYLEEDIIMGSGKVLKPYSSKLDKDSKKKIVNLLLKKGDALLQRRPWRYRLLTTMADLETLAIPWDKTALSKAEQLAKKIVAFAPYFPNSHLLAAKVYAISHNYPQALKEADITLQANPKIGSAYYIKAVVNYELNNQEKAKENLVKAAQNHYPFTNVPIILQTIDLLAIQKDYSTIAYLYQRAIALTPQNAALYAHLAGTYEKLHQWDKAIEYAKKSAMIDPKKYLKDSEVFIQKIQTEEKITKGDQTNSK